MKLKETDGGKKERPPLAASGNCLARLNNYLIASHLMPQKLSHLATN